MVGFDESQRVEQQSQHVKKMRHVEEVDMKMSDILSQLHVFDEDTVANDTKELEDMVSKVRGDVSQCELCKG